MIARPVLIFALLASASAAVPAWAQDKQAKKDAPFTLQQALGDPDNLTISGSVRLRYEAVDNQFRPAADRSGDDFLIRTTLAVDYDAGPVRIGGELWDSRAYGLDPNSPIGASDVNAVELVQAYVGLSAGDALGAGSKTRVTGGRFLLDLGSRRFVGINNFGNTTNAFTGVRADFQAADKTSVTLFYTLPQVHLPSDAASVRRNRVEWDRESGDLRFWGGFVSKPDLASGLSAEVYVFGLDERDRPDLATTNRHLVTPGLRLYRDPEPGRWDYEVEGAYQIGRVRTSTAANAPEADVSAYFVHAELGRQFAGGWKPRVALEYDRASGDGSNPKTYHRFDSLFGPRRGDWGPSGLYGALGRSNISSPGIRLDVTPDKTWDAFVFYRALWLDSAVDSFASTGIKDASGQSGRFAGHQIEARVRRWIIPKLLRLDTGAAVLINGGFLQNAPNPAGRGDPVYGYLDLTATF
ncbi:alginate export family protein [Hephaestia sp. GCM10023244]|uniref:alginate export family protein n=1 Tax=unclassified Hephaestia TaxID=2631281 RepID=UPI00207735BA|nr:alginate export family protein [Hephaestia sp. MAHUQ-44]MCM8731943.1 alginate export family protein [Hephaestia sp. MAHUQ-44]